MIRVEDRPMGRVPETVCFGVGGVADENAGDGSSVDLRIVCGDEGESFTADFVEVG